MSATAGQRLPRRLEDYEAFIAERCPHLCSAEGDAKGRCIYSVVRQVGGRRVGIAGFNSAWSSGSDDDKANLLLGEWQVDHLANALEHANADVKIALIHHPLNWCVDAEDPKLGPRLETEFHVLLHGHEHQQWVKPQDEHLCISAGAVLNRQDAALAYNVVRFDLETGDGEVWLRCLVGRSVGRRTSFRKRRTTGSGAFGHRSP